MYKKRHGRSLPLLCMHLVLNSYLDDQGIRANIKCEKIPGYSSNDTLRQREWYFLSSLVVSLKQLEEFILIIRGRVHPRITENMNMIVNNVWQHRNYKNENTGTLQNLTTTANTKNFKTLSIYYRPEFHQDRNYILQ